MDETTEETTNRFDDHARVSATSYVWSFDPTDF